MEFGAIGLAPGGALRVRPVNPGGGRLSLNSKQLSERVKSYNFLIGPVVFACGSFVSSGIINVKYFRNNVDHFRNATHGSLFLAADAVIIRQFKKERKTAAATRFVRFLGEATPERPCSAFAHVTFMKIERCLLKAETAIVHLLTFSLPNTIYGGFA